MREQTGSLLIWVLFAIIIAAFVLFFGSPSEQLGCGSSNDYAIEVDEKPVSVHSWRFAYNGIPLVYGNVPGDQRKPLALEFLVQREILAQAAEDMDFRVSNALIDEAIANGEFYLLGNKIDGTQVYFKKNEGEDPYFEYDYLTNLAQGRLGLPNVARYKKEQRREMLAHLMKQELLRSAYVSKEEARDAFIQNNTTVSANYVKFDALKYRSAVKLTEEQVARYADEHEDELKTEWEQVKPRWESDKARVRARIIKIARAQSDALDKDLDPEEGSEEGGDAEDEKGAAEAKLPPPEVPDAGRVAIDAAREKIVGGASFADVAAEVSVDPTASLGGLIGWRSAESMGYGQEVVDGSKDLEVGKISDVIETKRAYFLVVIEERSEKGLTFEQKKFDLAAKAAPTGVADDMARAAAEAALASAATTPLADLFPAAPADPSTIDLNNLPPEIREQLSPEQLEQLMKSAVPGGDTGAIVTEGPIQYAQLGGEEAGGEAAKPAAARKPAPPKPSTAAAPTASPALISSTEPAADAAEVPPPSLQTIRGTVRNGDFIAGVGRSDELVGDLFGTLAIGALGTKVYKVSDGDGYVVIQLTDRTEADMERFEEEAADLQAVLAEAKGGRRMQDWVLERCLSLKKNGAIKANPAMLQSSDEKLLPYEPCSLLSQGQ